MPYEKNIAKYRHDARLRQGAAPRLWSSAHVALQAWAETAEINRVEDGADHSIGMIASSHQLSVRQGSLRRAGILF